MKCRAKMCNGDPLTFEWTDHGLQRSPTGDRYVAEAVGDGFHVISEVDRYVAEGSFSLVEEGYRISLERSGVATATVEYWQEAAPMMRHGDEEWHTGDRWVPLFLPVLNIEPSSVAPGTVHWIDADRMVISDAKAVLVTLEATPEVHRRLEMVVKLAEHLLQRERM